MEIEIITTKRKLTQSIIKQMPFASLEELRNCSNVPELVYGYVVCGKAEFALLKGMKGAVKSSLLKWKRPGNANSTTLYSGNYTRTFNTTGEMEAELNIRNTVYEIARQTHIYI